MSERVRSYTWSDPIRFDPERVSGFDYLRAVAAGELPQPPIAATLGIRLAEVTEGAAVFEAEPADFHVNPLGVVHGGLALTLVDSAAGCAVQSALPAGASYTTLETKVNMVRAVLVSTGLLRCFGRIVHLGRTTATAEARVEDTEGKLYAHGTSTLLVVRPGTAP